MEKTCNCEAEHSYKYKLLSVNKNNEIQGDGSTDYIKFILPN